MRFHSFLGGTGIALCGMLLVTSCSSDVDEPLEPGHIQSVLLSISDFPGTPERTEEHFSSEASGSETDNDWATATEAFGSGQCTEAMDSLGGIDADNQAQSIGERRANLEPGGNGTVFRVAITSYEDEASVDSSWDDIQANCDGEVLTDPELDQQVTLEAAQVGDFRGLTELWEWENAEGETETQTHYSLSYADGHQVIGVGSDVDEETLEGLLDQQVEALQQGPEELETAEAFLDDYDLPKEQLTLDELSNVVAHSEEFPFDAPDADAETGTDLLDQQHSTWTGALMAVTASIVDFEGDMPTDECTSYWQAAESTQGPFPHQQDTPTVISVAERAQQSEADGPEGAGVMMQSSEEAPDAAGSSARWASFLDACAGDFEHDEGTQSISALDIEGIDGFTAHKEATSTNSPDEYTASYAHLSAGHNAVHVVGFNISESEMEELITAQLEKLEAVP